MMFDESTKIVKAFDQPSQVVGILRLDKQLQFRYGNGIQRGSLRLTSLLRQVTGRERAKTRVSSGSCAIAACLDTFQYALESLKETEQLLTSMLKLIGPRNIGMPRAGQFRMNRKSGNSSDQVLGLF